MSDNAPENGMALSDLDGFLTGILVGPELIMPSEWLPHVWGGEAPTFENEEPARLILSTVMGRYNEIARALDGEPSDPWLPLCRRLRSHDTCQEFSRSETSS